MAERLPEQFQLEIVTPHQLLFSGEVSQVSVPGTQGYFGVLSGHAPLLSELDIGVISYAQGGDEFHLYCGRGFVEVLPDRVSVLAETAQTVNQIDVDQAHKDKQEAERILSSGAEDVDYDDAMTTLRQAEAQLDTARRSATI